ncbi:MAG: ADP-ribosylation factor-like protein [Promethearchaeota archaeon]
MKKRSGSRENSYINELKILLLGDDSIKTSVMQRFSSNLFKSDSKLTIGVDFQVKIIEFDGSRIKLQLWDVINEKRVLSLLPMYIRGSKGAIFLYDITRPSSLDNLSDCLGIVRSNADNIPIILAGVSLGSEEDHNNFSEEGLKVAKRNNLNGFIECSANL